MSNSLPRNSVFLLLAFAVLLTGCDPVRSTQQTVKFNLTDQEGKPVPGIRVELKESFTSYATSNGLEKQRQESWEKLPWESAISDDSGMATVNIENTMIDRSSGEVPNAESNVVGRSYQLRLEGGESNEIEIQAGLSVTIDGVSVSVSEISKPKYIQTKN